MLIVNKIIKNLVILGIFSLFFGGGGFGTLEAGMIRYHYPHMGRKSREIWAIINSHETGVEGQSVQDSKAK